MDGANSQSMEQRPRIILLMQFYDPEPIYKGQSFAEAVAARGYEVEVVTGFPNYPGGKIYPGYKLKPVQKSLENGIYLTRLWLYPSHDGGRLGRVLNYVSFFLTSFIYLTFFARKPDLIYAYHPPLTVGLSATLAARFRRKPSIVDIHDLWPDTLPATNMLSNPRLLRLIGKGCDWMYRRVTHIIVHSEGFKRVLLSRGVPEEKVTPIIGWGQEVAEIPIDPETQEQTNIIRSAKSLSVLFAGNMGPAQALDNVLDAASILKARGMEDTVTFFLLGSGLSLDTLKARVASEELNAVRFLTRVSPEAVPHYLQTADSLLVHLSDNPLFNITLPSKTQTYMIAGKPILMSVGGEAADLIKACGGGVTARPGSPESLVEAALQLAEASPETRARMGKAAQDYYWSELSMDVGVDRFHAVFQTAMATRTASTDSSHQEVK